MFWGEQIIWWGKNTRWRLLYEQRRFLIGNPLVFPFRVPPFAFPICLGWFLRVSLLAFQTKGPHIPTLVWFCNLPRLECYPIAIFHNGRAGWFSCTIPRRFTRQDFVRHGLRLIPINIGNVPTKMKRNGFFLAHASPFDLASAALHWSIKRLSWSPNASQIACKASFISWDVLLSSAKRLLRLWLVVFISSPPL